MTVTTMLLATVAISGMLIAGIIRQIKRLYSFRKRIRGLNHDNKHI